ncbi:uncharacterized protein [Blastocystis hominis]|uniref:Uncharacterized protein n=1 Tax=Blastocystis hominis TaxID=12968 RepID=D8M683_BLAHO|nr:uncharacterized protein [Blastocystis hominis]CBK23636.2 unnamed protein product [Blastocystis hominis]|eukprot:XP_012897684.1 uncharacterized protein [Blastocystis hominis]
MQNPQEQRQEVLIKRIANSVDRLSVALADLTKQMEQIDQYTENLEYLQSIWRGCEQKMCMNSKVN